MQIEYIRNLLKFNTSSLLGYANLWEYIEGRLGKALNSLLISSLRHFERGLFAFHLLRLVFGMLQKALAHDTFADFSGKSGAAESLTLQYVDGNQSDYELLYVQREAPTWDKLKAVTVAEAQVLRGFLAIKPQTGECFEPVPYQPEMAFSACLESGSRCANGVRLQHVRFLRNFNVFRFKVIALHSIW